MKCFVTSTTVLCLLLGTASVLAQRPDFSGMWTLDREASEFSPPAFKALFMTVWCPDSRSVESNCGIPRG